MLFSKKTIMVLFPEGPGKVRRFRMPRFLLFLFFLVLISWTACLSWVFWDYHSMRTRLSRVNWFEKEKGHNRMRFNGLERRLDRFAQKMDLLEEFASNLEYMLDVETGLSHRQFSGMGGSDDDLDKPNGPKEEFKYRMQLVSRLLQDIDERIGVVEYSQTACRKFMEDRELVLALVRPIWYKKGSGNADVPSYKGTDVAPQHTDSPAIQFANPSNRSPQPLPACP